MTLKNYNVISDERVPIKLWNKYVKIEDAAIKQLRQVASMPFIHSHIAAMPDTHWGMGATVGSVIPTKGAVMPAAVGVDIGCGMLALRTTLKHSDLNPLRAENLQMFFEKISAAVPHGRSHNGDVNDIGSWRGAVPGYIQAIWEAHIEPLVEEEDGVFDRHPNALSKNALRQLGTLGTGNHFIELAVEIDNEDSPIYIVLHSGSRGFGNRIGSYFTKLARELNEKWFIQLPNRDLGYLPVGTQEYEDYVQAVQIAQKFAWMSRDIMAHEVLKALGTAESEALVHRKVGESLVLVPSKIHIHHNYLALERHFGEDTILTRKGAVNAEEGNFVIIPGSMGAKTFIGIGRGNRDSFHSCSHGAGRAMSRTEALKTFTVEDHVYATEGVVCDKTTGTLDETPGAYKSIEDVMESQRDLVTPVMRLKQILSVKGISD